MCAMMNLFYCLKALRGNVPACFEAGDRYGEFRDLPAQPSRAGAIDRKAAGNGMIVPVFQPQPNTTKSAAGGIG